MQRTHFQQVFTVGIWFLLAGMAAFVWIKKGQHPVPPLAQVEQMPAPLAEQMPAEQPTQMAAAAVPESTTSTQKMAPLASDPSSVSVTMALPAPPDSAHRRAAPNVVENYRALARISYTLPQYNRDNRRDGDPVLEAEKLLWKNRLPEALTQLTALPPGSPDTWAAERIRAHVFFKQGKMEQAEKVFSKIRNSPLADGENNWYLLLCALADAGNNLPKFKQLAAELQHRSDAGFSEKLAALEEKIFTLRQEGKL